MRRNCRADAASPRHRYRESRVCGSEGDAIQPAARRGRHERELYPAEQSGSRSSARLPACRGSDGQSWNAHIPQTERGGPSALTQHEARKAEPLDGLPARAVAVRPLRPMLASSGTQLPKGAGWSYEVKWDGYRTFALKDKSRVQLPLQIQRRHRACIRPIAREVGRAARRVLAA